jgi:hypothetical protein
VEAISDDESPPDRRILDVLNPNSDVRLDLRLEVGKEAVGVAFEKRGDLAIEEVQVQLCAAQFPMKPV